MIKRRFIAVLSGIFVLFLTIVIVINSTKNQISTPVDDTFKQYTNKLFKSMLPTDSFSLHYCLNSPEKYGIDNVNCSIGNFNYREMLNCDTYYAGLLEQLNEFNYEDLSDENKVTYDCLQFYFRNEMDFSDYVMNYEVLTPTTGIQAQLPILLNQYSFNSIKDVTDYLSMLSSIPSYFDSICDFEEEKARNGYFMSQSNLQGIIRQCNEFADSPDNFLISDFPERLSALNIDDESQLSTFSSQNRDAITNIVIPAYQKLATRLKEISKTVANPDSTGCLCHYPKGKNYYSYLARSYTGSSRTVHDMEKMIKSKLRTDLATLLKYNNNPDILSELQHIDEEPVDARGIIDSLINDSLADFPKPQSINYTLKDVPKSLEQHLSPAFYIVPPIDLPNKNIIYLNQTSNNGYMEMYATLAHEGYPGHLYQCNYFSSGSPDSIRHLINFDGYNEGWATYVEIYSYRYLFENSNTAQYMAANASYSLALHALCDIGVNYRGWSVSDTASHLHKYGVVDVESAQAIFNLVTESPANYLKYYVGYLEILSLKESFKQSLGTRYSDKKFHTFLLEQGPAPFEVIRNNIPLYK